MHNENPSDFGHRNRYSAAIRDARTGGLDSFQNWFNRSENADHALVRGHWDFATHILTPMVTQFISNPEDLLALEIGYGGGRLLAAACSFFRFVVGVDLHAEYSTVDGFLRANGRSNFALMQSNGRTIDCQKNSIDFIYSFIVLQHLPSFDVLKEYVHESFLCLRAGGVARLYFGSYRKLGIIRQGRNFRQGFAELSDAPVNHTWLVVTTSTMQHLCTQA